MFFSEGKIRVFVYGKPVSTRLSYDGLYVIHQADISAQKIPSKCWQCRCVCGIIHCGSSFGSWKFARQPFFEPLFPFKSKPYCIILNS